VPPRLTTSIAVLLAGAGVAGCGDEAKREPGPLPRVDRSLLAYERGRPLDARSRRIARGQGLVVERITYRSFDRERVPGLFAHAAGARRAPCIVFQHGFGASKDTAALAWGSLGGEGVSTLSIDARFHGERARKGLGPPEAARDPRLLYRAFRETTIDLRRAVDYLERRPECDPRRIGYIGGSFGGMVGALLAGADRRVKAPVLFVGGADWRTILEGSDVFLPGVERDPRALRLALRRLEPLDPERWAPRISPRPVLIAYGTRDRTIVPAAGRALARAAREPKEVLTYTGGHTAVLSSRNARIARAMNGWVLKHLVRVEAF
jgi:cephalosporin-C deacetylase-like acetyl esterase